MHNAHAETLFFREIAAAFVIKMWDKEKKHCALLLLRFLQKFIVIYRTAGIIFREIVRSLVSN